MKQITYTFTDTHFATVMSAVLKVKPIPTKDGVATMTEAEWLKVLGANAIEKIAIKGAKRQRLDGDPIDYTTINNIISGL